jgi:molybdenum cofactor cytidylyltransferase
LAFAHGALVECELHELIALARRRGLRAWSTSSRAANFSNPNKNPMRESSVSRVFAVVPAAGRSRRMGRPKLLLPFDGTTVLGRLLDTLKTSRVSECCVVVRGDDEALKAEAQAHGARVVQPPVDPPDMRASVEWALRDIARRHQPCDDDGWLLIPADHPLLSSRLLSELLAAWDEGRPRILVPKHHGRRGHPTLFRWSAAAEIDAMPPERGVNWLLERHADQVVELPYPFPEATQDLDTPEDYARLLGTPLS